MAPAVSSNDLPPPWTLGTGYAVLARGGACALLLGFLVVASVGAAPALGGFATLLSALPFLWLARRHLLRPHGDTFVSRFGLAPTGEAAGSVARMSLAVTGLMIAGEMIIAYLTQHWDGPLWESIPESFLFDPWPRVLLDCIDTVVWAPLVEEITFRGVLYGSLRRRLRPGWAALISSLVFAGVHGYSGQGSLVIFWSGLLWAFAYERSRSLVPAIFCHALSNAMAVLAPIVLYRL